MVYSPAPPPPPTNLRGVQKHAQVWVLYSSVTISTELKQNKLHKPTVILHFSPWTQTSSPSTILTPSFLFFFHRLAETKEMSRSWLVLCFPVHSFLLHHYPPGKNHSGSPCHRDQCHTLLLPDAVYCTTSHLPQVSTMEKVAHLGLYTYVVKKPP